MNADARAERFWWDDHADEIHVWGEEGDAAWFEGTEHCLAMLAAAAPPTREGLRGIRLPDPTNPTLMLDLGCGMGRLTIPMSQRYAGCILGVDSSATMIAEAQRAARVALADTVAFVLGDGRTLPPEARTDEIVGGVPYWFAWSVLLFQHIPPDAQRSYVEQVAKVLAPGGRYVVQIDAGEGTHGSFLHWQTSVSHLAGWACDAGLGFVNTPVRDERYPQWLWVTMEKP